MYAKVLGRGIVGLALLCFGAATGACRADFVLYTPTPSSQTELKLYNSVPAKGVMSFTGSVGMQSGGFPVLVQAGSAMDVTIDTGAGFATIKPDTGLLTSLTFTPQSNTVFNDFATNGQLQGPTGSASETFSLSVVAREPDGTNKTFVFGPTTIKADSNGAFPFDYAVIGLNGETIQSVTFSAPDGIKESKQTEFSLAPGVTLPQPVPEPSTIGLTLSGLASLGLVGLRRLKRRQTSAIV
jgi:hypothetical protein